jgi:hypothetical protein
VTRWARKRLNIRHRPALCSWPAGSPLTPSWLESEAEFREGLRGEFELNLTNEEIDQCVAVMKIKGTGDPPHPFFA